MWIVRRSSAAHLVIVGGRRAFRRGSASRCRDGRRATAKAICSICRGLGSRSRGRPCAQAGSATARPQNAPAAISESRRGPREKVFGPGRCVPMDRNAKVRVMTLARALSRRQEPGKAYGRLTAKHVAVLAALLWSFHNAGSGKCFPSYEAIADRAACSISRRDLRRH
jgi:hypothetical protein